MRVFLVSGLARGLPGYKSLGEGIVAWAYAHGVVPGYREGPPDEAAQDGLAEGERENIALAGE